MITIGRFTEGGFVDYYPEQFVKDFLSICQEHRRDRRALLFAFLVYDFEHAEVIKVLKDEHYWNGINNVSGSRISVFAFHSPIEKGSVLKASRLPKFNAPADMLLKKHFEVDAVTMPTIVFFQVTDDKVIGQFQVPLRETTIESAFNEIRSILQTVITAVENVTPDNYSNSQEIFNLVEQQLSQRRTLERARWIATKIGSVQSWIEGIARAF